MSTRRAARLLSDRKASIAMMTGLLAVPITLLVGSAVDVARLTNTQATLKDAVDRAALAGASLYSTDNAITRQAAQQAALNNFSQMQWPSMVTAYGSPSAVAAPGTTQRAGSANNVTVTASVKVQTTFMAMVMPSVTLTASSVGSNPQVQLNIGYGHFGSQAGDWNSIYVYPVPTGSNGKPDFTQVPAPADLLASGYEISSNCDTAAGDACTGQTGAMVDNTNRTLTISSTTVIGFALRNVTGGRYGGYTNGYGSVGGESNWFYSSFLGAALPPDNNTNAYAKTQGNSKTTYPPKAPHITPQTNCNLIVQAIPANSAIPTAAPISGSCFTPTDTNSGAQYTTLTCAQMQGKTYMFWWNDMGGGSDDKDFNDIYYTVSCSASGTKSGAIVSY